MAPRTPDEAQLALECLDRALKTQCADSAMVVRVAEEFYEFVTGTRAKALLRQRLEAAGVI